MVRLMLLLCIVIILCTLWILLKKIIKAQREVQKRKQQAQFNEAKLIEAARHEVRALHISEVQIDAHEQQLFDDIATLFLQRQCVLNQQDEAVQLQDEILAKMPMQCKSQIRQLDLAEWSIYWHFYQQSLEYYVGRYGVFAVHVDRFGQEHRQQITDLSKPS